MAPYMWRRPYSLTYPHNVRYGTGLYYSTLDDIEKKYLYSLGSTRLPYDRYDSRFTSLPRSPLAYGRHYSPSSIFWSTGYASPKFTSNLYDPLPRLYSRPAVSSPLRRSLSYSDLDDLRSKPISDSWTPLSSYLYPDGTSPLRRTPSVEDLAPRRRCRTPDLYDMGSKLSPDSKYLDPSFWNIWYNATLHRSPVMFRRRLAYFLR